MGDRTAVHGFPTAPVGPVARCKECGNAAMVPVSSHAIERAFLQLQMQEGTPECPMECAYCGAKDTVRGADYIDHAFLFDDAVRARWASKLREERAKVERLKEGRW